jgi:hypothetical protein
MVFIIGATITIAAGIVAKMVLAPMRKRVIEASNGVVEKEELQRTRQYA